VDFGRFSTGGSLCEWYDKITEKWSFANGSTLDSDDVEVVVTGFLLYLTCLFSFFVIDLNGIFFKDY